MTSISPAFQAGVAPRFSGQTVALPAAENEQLDRALNGQHGLFEAVRNGIDGYMEAALQTAIKAVKTPADAYQVISTITKSNESVTGEFDSRVPADAKARRDGAIFKLMQKAVEQLQQQLT
jgi:hypothetical protein